MSAPRWVDFDLSSDLGVGDIAYLAEVVDTTRGTTSWHLSKRPLRTNMSREPKLRGWCGETNNRSLNAHGVVRVSAISRAGDRARISSVSTADTAAFLEACGHPDLVAS